MDKESIEELIDQNLSQRAIGLALGTSQGNVVYWMKKHGLKSRGQRLRCGEHLCSCGERNSDMFYGHRKNMCKSCFNKQTIRKGDENKSAGLKYLGAKCSKCEYDKCTAALHFHHIDQLKKDPEWHGYRSWGIKRLLSELDNCIVLCANCHAEEHSKCDIL